MNEEKNNKQEYTMSFIESFLSALQPIFFYASIVFGVSNLVNQLVYEFFPTEWGSSVTIFGLIFLTMALMIRIFFMNAEIIYLSQMLAIREIEELTLPGIREFKDTIKTIAEAEKSDIYVLKRKLKWYRDAAYMYKHRVTRKQVKKKFKQPKWLREGDY